MDFLYHAAAMERDGGFSARNPTPESLVVYYAGNFGLKVSGGPLQGT
jgi:hypothetical protein